MVKEQKQNLDFSKTSNVQFELTKEEIRALQGKHTNLEMFMDNLGAGTVRDLLERLISEISLACMVHGKKKGVLKLDMDFLSHPEVDQLVVQHKITYTMPTSTGKKTEETSGDCLFYVGNGGRLFEQPPEEDWRGQVDMFGS